MKKIHGKQLPSRCNLSISGLTCILSSPSRPELGELIIEELSDQACAFDTSSEIWSAFGPDLIVGGAERLRLRPVRCSVAGISSTWTNVFFTSTGTMVASGLARNSKRMVSSFLPLYVQRFLTVKDQEFVHVIQSLRHLNAGSASTTTADSWNPRYWRWSWKSSLPHSAKAHLAH